MRLRDRVRETVKALQDVILGRHCSPAFFESTHAYRVSAI
jgi:hypothetical protein